MTKVIKVSPTKAYRVEGIIAANGLPMLSIRQMYATKSDPKFKPSKQGITIGLDEISRVVNALRATVDEGKDTFTNLQE